MNASQATSTPPAPRISPPIDEQYRNLLRPIPLPTPRTTFWIVLGVALVAWSFAGAGVDFISILNGIPRG